FSTDTSPTHTFGPGTFDVALTALGPGGENTQVQPALIHVSPPGSPTASFTVDRTAGNVPLSVQFSDRTTGAGTSWSWSFRDGVTSNVQNPSHIYTSGGVSPVTLTAPGRGGSNASTKVGLVTANVRGTLDVDFTATNTTGVAPLTVRFRAFNL